MSQNQTNTEWVAIVLAAGQGTRMKSPLPKVLHEIAGRPLVAWSIAAALDAGVQRCVAVVGHGREQVESTLHTRFGGRVSTALQAEQRGTGHAVRCAMESPALATFEGNVVILYGDCPLIPKESVHALVHALDADASPGAVPPPPAPPAKGPPAGPACPTPSHRPPPARAGPQTT